MCEIHFSVANQDSRCLFKSTSRPLASQVVFHVEINEVNCVGQMS